MTGRSRSGVLLVLGAITATALVIAALDRYPGEDQSAAEPVSASSSDAPTMLFVGDSYTEGNGPMEQSPACRAATELGYVCRLAAIGGTGFISGGQSNRFEVAYRGPSTTIGERIPGLAATSDPAVVVIDGGRNDTFVEDRDAVDSAAADALSAAARAWPGAQLVLLRPRFLADPDDDLGFSDARLARMVGDAGVPGMIVIDPLYGIGRPTHDLIGADGIHPNAAGENVITGQLRHALAEHGLQVRDES